MPYKTMQGKELDLDKLRIKNEMTLAVGNVKVNARGDELGPGGQIIRKREDIMNEYHQPTNAVPSRQPKTKAAAPKAETPQAQINNEFDDLDSEAA